MTDLRTPLADVDVDAPLAPPPTLPVAAVPTKKRRGRHLTLKESSKKRQESPSFTASVTAARLAWEAKEEKKEEKREKKRRRSEAKEGERRSTSQLSNRCRGNSGPSAQAVWDADAEGYREKDATNRAHGRPAQAAQAADDYDDDDEVYTGRRSTPESARTGVAAAAAAAASSSPSARVNCSSRGRNATGKRWGLLGNQKSSSSSSSRSSLKKRWLGFIVWVRIGMVRLGRKMGF